MTPDIRVVPSACETGLRPLTRAARLWFARTGVNVERDYRCIAGTYWYTTRGALPVINSAYAYGFKLSH